MPVSSSSSPVLLTLQGNIGAGKSLLHEKLKECWKANQRVCFVPEPVSIWTSIRDKDGKNMIEKYYADQCKYAFSFQMMAYISRLSILREALKGDYDVIVSERSLETDRHVFAAMLHDQGKIEDVEYQIYVKWFEEFKEDFPEEQVVYVKASPETSHKRVKQRARPGEEIPLDYLRSCHDYHEKWLCNRETQLTLDGDTDVKEEPEVLEKWIGQVGKFCGLN